MSNVLVTRPNHDQTTDYLFHWSKPVIDFAKKHLQTFDLASKKANKKNFDSYVKAHDPKFFFLNGHGSDSTITGQDNETLIDANQTNLNTFAGCLFYVRSCKSGKVLGDKLVEAGVSAFIGYKNNFTFVRHLDFATRPLQDPIAKHFLEPSNLVPATLIKGNSVSDAYNRSQQDMKRNFAMLVSSTSSEEGRSAASFLWFNINAQVLLGNHDSRI